MWKLFLDDHHVQSGSSPQQLKIMRDDNRTPNLVLSRFFAHQNMEILLDRLHSGAPRPAKEENKHFQYLRFNFPSSELRAAVDSSFPETSS